ncbi:MAG: phosphate ABC transporter substrate-binding protein PstS, partial [Ilumatobacteraceae bacterium]
MNPVKRRLVIAGIISLSFVAAACGSDSKSSSTAAPVVSDAPTSSTAAPAADTTVAAVATTEGGATATTAAAAPATVDFSKLTGKLAGSGATFPKSFYDDSIARLADIAPDLTVEYGGGGSGTGQTDLQANLKDFVGSDGTVKAADVPKYTGGPFVYIPTVIAPITLSYNLPDVAKLQLSATSVAAIFQREITKWNDPLVAADNPGVTLPATDIVVVVRADPSGTTQNFTTFLEKAAGPDSGGAWKLGAAKDTSFPTDGTQRGDGNSGVAQIVSATNGAIGYVDLSDAKANNLVLASVKNKAGKYV